MQSRRAMPAAPEKKWRSKDPVLRLSRKRLPVRAVCPTCSCEFHAVFAPRLLDHLFFGHVGVATASDGAADGLLTTIIRALERDFFGCAWASLVHCVSVLLVLEVAVAETLVVECFAAGVCRHSLPSFRVLLCLVPVSPQQFPKDAGHSQKPEARTAHFCQGFFCHAKSASCQRACCSGGQGARPCAQPDEVRFGDAALLFGAGVGCSCCRSFPFAVAHQSARPAMPCFSFFPDPAQTIVLFCQSCSMQQAPTLRRWQPPPERTLCSAPRQAREYELPHLRPRDEQSTPRKIW